MPAPASATPPAAHLWEVTALDFTAWFTLWQLQVLPPSSEQQGAPWAAPPLAAAALERTFLSPLQLAQCVPPLRVKRTLSSRGHTLFCNPPEPRLTDLHSEQPPEPPARRAETSQNCGLLLEACAAWGVESGWTRLWPPDLQPSPRGR